VSSASHILFTQTSLHLSDGTFLFWPFFVPLAPLILMLGGIYKKSPADSNGNAQQRCMFESPVKQNPT